ncbi:LLM class flavin-dependent oxidoreductase [Antrihabitans stalactiti]|uniref:LLM class flavin-dependent oxidoreductase n=1 Tax=Antrihabitans stalactiti TaxID=2584121 RepID=A0A848KJG2_9NOCA|nr:LLM class flavin-dependent oxidoreductase [Antrihabitans stalactiti]NMN98261.1 LLM class flavin-dependent oxidoreductase [Antrihabitans stalactiti]
MRLSVLDLAPVSRTETIAESFTGSVALARAAEAAGYERVWYAEHHNMPTIASSATAVLIAHIAAHTSTIRLGAGGVMLPNHSPLVIAEQFGTLATLHPGRIDLGLGRAPGTDQRTFRAMRRDVRASDQFPQDVLELQAYLAGRSAVEGVQAFPGAGTNVPLYILGSSMFGASLAAQLGLPYAFASHFAPDLLLDAVAAYRANFRPSEQLSEPYVIAAFNATVAPTHAEADEIFAAVRRSRVRSFLLRGVAQAESFTDDELDAVATTPQGRQVLAMMRRSVVGTADDAIAAITEFAAEADADEVMLAFHGRRAVERVRALELVADARERLAA